jgi:hypothetical protein
VDELYSSDSDCSESEDLSPDERKARRQQQRQQMQMLKKKEQQMQKKYLQIMRQ